MRSMAHCSAQATEQVTRNSIIPARSPAAGRAKLPLECTFAGCAWPVSGLACPSLALGIEESSCPNFSPPALNQRQAQVGTCRVQSWIQALRWIRGMGMLDPRGLVCRTATGDLLRVREVWQDNLEDEMAIIESIVEDFPFLAMDTEFPGATGLPSRPALRLPRIPSLHN